MGKGWGEKAMGGRRSPPGEGERSPGRSELPVHPTGTYVDAPQSPGDQASRGQKHVHGFKSPPSSPPAQGTCDLGSFAVGD